MQFPSEPVKRDGETDRYLVPMSVGVRAMAYLIDCFLFAMITVLVLYTFNAVDVITKATRLTYVELVLVGAQCVYFFFFEAVFGWTPGKRVFQMRVVGADGGRCGVLASFLRNLIRPIDVLFFGIVGCMSILSGFKRQRLGDRLARTQVVRPVPLAFVPPPYVPADKPESRRCPRCGALAESGQQKCKVCGFDLDSAPQAQWPFGIPGFPMAGRPTQGSGATGEPTEEHYVADEDYDEEEAGPDEAGAGGRPAGERPAGEPSTSRRPAARPGGAGSAGAPTPPFGMPANAAAGGRESDLAADLYDDDADARLYAGREILMEGGKEDVRELARAVKEWDAADREFIINIARTLDGWRPVLVLEALRNDPDEELATGAREALDTVNERNEREESERKAWEAARAGRLEDDEDEDEAPYDDEPYDDEPYDEEPYDDEEPAAEEPAAAGAVQLPAEDESPGEGEPPAVEPAAEEPAAVADEEPPAAPDAPEAPAAPDLDDKPADTGKSG